MKLQRPFEIRGHTKDGKTSSSRISVIRIEQCQGLGARFPSFHLPFLIFVVASCERWFSTDFPAVAAEASGPGSTTMGAASFLEERKSLEFLRGYLGLRIDRSSCMQFRAMLSSPLRRRMLTEEVEACARTLGLHPVKLLTREPACTFV